MVPSTCRTRKMRAGHCRLPLLLHRVVTTVLPTLAGLELVEVLHHRIAHSSRWTHEP